MDPDHVGLQPEHGDGGQRGRQPGRAAAEGERQGDEPTHEGGEPEYARVDAELGVGRLPGKDLDAGALRDDAGVTEPVTLRVLDDEADTVAQVLNAE